MNKYYLELAILINKDLYLAKKVSIQDYKRVEDFLLKELTKYESI